MAEPARAKAALLRAYADPRLVALRTALAIGLRVLVANWAGAIIVFVYLTFLTPRTDTGDEARILTITGVTFALYLGLTLLGGSVLSWSSFRTVFDWLASGRPATERERKAVLAQPLRQAGWPLLFWAGAVLVFGPLNLVLREEPDEAARVVFANLDAAMITFALTYLLVERRLRPVVAMAHEGAPGPRRGVGILPRLLLSWLLGSAVPLMAIGFSQIAHTPEERTRLVGPTWFLVAAGLGSGFLVTVVAARSVSDPLRKLRKATDRVAAGDVDVSVPVDDGSEVGDLQAGFNQMVAGLRERRLLRELFGRYVGDEVAREALDRGVGLGGSRHAASALFVDLIGSTRLAATAPPEEVVATLNALFGAVVGTVTAEGGWVNKFDGDGALAVFGPPAGREDHAAAALRAARALRAELARLGLDAGVGVSSGTVVAGNVGAEDRYEYTVIGDPVNEAARLTVLAKERPSRLLAAGPAVAAAGTEAAGWRPAGVVTLRGREEPTEAYEPVQEEHGPGSAEPPG